MANLIEENERLRAKLEQAEKKHASDMFNAGQITGGWIKQYREAEARARRLEEALREMLPRYIELFTGSHLGNENDSVAVQIARAALKPHS